MAQIDETLGLGPQFLGDEYAGSPIRNHRRVERGLVELVLDEHAPIGGNCRINGARALQIAVQGVAELLLAGKICAIADPHGQRLRTQGLAELYAFDIVLHSLGAHRGEVWVKEP